MSIAAAQCAGCPNSAIARGPTDNLTRYSILGNCDGVQLHLGCRLEHRFPGSIQRIHGNSSRQLFGVRADAAAKQGSTGQRRTCRLCHRQFDPSENHPRACRFHTAHFGGETARKFEGVDTGGTMTTVGGGTISQYWHCCGSTDAQDPGCEAAPHSTYDD